MTGRFSLTPAEMDRYRCDGFLLREGVFTEVEVRAMGEAAERAVASALELCDRGRPYVLDGNRFVDIDTLTVQFEHAEDSATVRVIEPVCEIEPAFDELIDDPRIAQPMCDLVGSQRVALWTGKLNLKRPREGSAFRWHQDSPYWVHDSNHVDQLPNVLVALDDATETNGCLRVVRGSHVHGCLPGRSDKSQLGGFFTDPDSFDESQQVPMVVPAGSLVFFSPHAVHGSLPNESDEPRRALVLTYQPSGFLTLKSRISREVRGG